MSHNLFVYGLLQHPQVLQPLIGFVPKISPARLSNHSRRILLHEDFEPCAVAVSEPGRCIEGMILHDLDAQAVAHMDVFECVERGIYTRNSVVPTLSCGTTVECDVYLRGPSLKSNNLGDYWNQEAFNDKHMDYVMRELIPQFANY